MIYKKKITYVMQHTPWGYSRCFFNNPIESYLYCILETPMAKEFENKQNITADKRRNGHGIEACITIDGKKIRLHNYIMKTNTANGEETDHINHEPLDCRECNLRNGTRLQNLCNTEKGIGKIKLNQDNLYYIDFSENSGIDSTPYTFESRVDAEIMREKLLAEHPLYKDWTYINSKKLAEENESYEFVYDKWVDSWAATGTMGKIMSLSPKNELNAKIRDLQTAVKRGLVYPDEEWQIAQTLKHDFHIWKQENEQE